jgi:dinuclear metal center YbgI/SA1388 family protein
MKIKQLADFMDAFLEVKRFKDYCPNGLQVECDAPLQKIALGVSASLELFKKAKKNGAQAVIVHHGIFWDKTPQPLVGVQGKRIEFLFQNGISLLAYHLPLDAHPQIGNNASIADALNLKDRHFFAEHGGVEIGVSGTLEHPLPLPAVKKKILALFGKVDAAFAFGPKKVRKIAIVSGGAASDVMHAQEKGADLFLTGETDEPTQEWCREAGIHFLSVGHALSEQMGIKNLGKIITDQFKIPCVYLPVPNRY